MKPAVLVGAGDSQIESSLKKNHEACGLDKVQTAATTSQAGWSNSTSRSGDPILVPIVLQLVVDLVDRWLEHYQLQNLLLFHPVCKSCWLCVVRLVAYLLNRQELWDVQRVQLTCTLTNYTGGICIASQSITIILDILGCIFGWSNVVFCSCGDCLQSRLQCREGTDVAINTRFAEQSGCNYYRFLKGRTHFLNEKSMFISGHLQQESTTDCCVVAMFTLWLHLVTLRRQFLEFEKCKDDHQRMILDISLL